MSVNLMPERLNRLGAFSLAALLLLACANESATPVSVLGASTSGGATTAALPGLVVSNIAQNTQSTHSMQSAVPTGQNSAAVTSASAASSQGPLPSASASVSAVASSAAPTSASVSPSVASSVAPPGASANNAGECAPFVMPSDCSIPEGAVLPGELRCTGLYGDWAARKLHCSVAEYTPAYPLWSDGSEKYRYVSLPAGKQVDVSDPDDFRYPNGTQFWKEFRVPDAGGFRVGETRLMRRVDGGWMYTTYVWSKDGSTAVQQNEGVADLFASGHTVPARQQCKECHEGRRDYILGWDGILLGEGAKGITRQSLLNENKLTWKGKESGQPSPLSLAVPGDAVERAALGYLHSNCGVSCHNDSTAALARETGFFTRLDADTLDSVFHTDAFRTGLNRQPNPNAPLKDLALPPDGGEYIDLRPLDVVHSLTLVRMKLRNVEAAMPRIGTNRVDTQGVALVQAWIESMTQERGYPSP